MKGLRISLGWNDMPARRIHRCDPCTQRLMPGMKVRSVAHKAAVKSRMLSFLSARGGMSVKIPPTTRAITNPIP